MKHSSIAIMILGIVVGLNVLIGVFEYRSKADQSIEGLGQGWHAVEVRVIGKDRYQIRRPGAKLVVEVYREQTSDATPQMDQRYLLPKTDANANTDANTDPVPFRVGNHERRTGSSDQRSTRRAFTRTACSGSRFEQFGDGLGGVHGEEPNNDSR